MEHDDLLIYYLWLTGINGIGPVTQHALLDELMIPEAVYNASETELLRAGMTENCIRLILEARDLDGANKSLNSAGNWGSSS